MGQSILESTLKGKRMDWEHLSIIQATFLEDSGSKEKEMELEFFTMKMEFKLKKACGKMETFRNNLQTNNGYKIKKAIYSI